MVVAATAAAANAAKALKKVEGRLTAVERRETAREDVAADGDTPAYSFVTLDRVQA